VTILIRLILYINYIALIVSLPQPLLPHLKQLQEISFFFLVLEFELRVFISIHSTNRFLWRFFSRQGLKNYLLGLASNWISASWIARITGMSHQHLAQEVSLFCFIQSIITSYPLFLTAFSTHPYILRIINSSKCGYCLPLKSSPLNKTTCGPGGSHL
jgi:hypothetical protein